MTTQRKELCTTDEATPDERAIADYLRHHPEFFERHPDLLAELQLPHDSGAAVSLVERQMAVLREQRESLRERLRELVLNAQSNEALSAQMHRLVLDLLATSDLEGVVATLRDGLHRYFSADAMSLRLFVPAPAGYAGEEFADVDELRRSRFKKVFTAPAPLCGRIDPELCDFLFGDEAAEIASGALIPVAVDEGVNGVLAVGSYDPEHFHARMGTHFLEHLGEITGRVLHPHLTA